jgi:hypothetical protein
MDKTVDETVKKTPSKTKSKVKAPAKPSKKSAATNGAPARKTNGTPASVTEMRISHQQVAELAHRLWAERGGQHGHDAEDWFRAEQALRSKAS